jgi:arsenite methyltransferase
MTTSVKELNEDAIREKVRERYGEFAKQGSGCGCSCSAAEPADASKAIGYTDEQLSGIPAEADLGLGCGNPTAFAEIREGDTVVDLGSGAGIDCFLAAKSVGASGKVIGIDMTDEMLDRARRNASKGGFTNVEFRKGIIEQLPLGDASADIVISNCVINLSPDKPRVFAEVHRVLKPGGRMMVSDIVLAEPLPPQVQKSVEAWVGCISGAMLRDDYYAAIRNAGFDVVEEVASNSYGEMVVADSGLVARFAQEFGADEASVRRWASAVLSVKVRAVKAKRSCCG